MTKRKHKDSVYLQAVKRREALIDWLKGAGPATGAFFDDWALQARHTPVAVTMPNDRDGRQIARDLGHRAAATELFYVTDEVGRLIQEAAETMPPHLMTAEDVPALQGWVHFERPLGFLPIAGDTMWLDAFLWSRESVGEPHSNTGTGPGFVNFDFATMDVQHPPLRSEMGASDLFPIAYGTLRDGRIPWVMRSLEKHGPQGVDLLQDDPTMFRALENYYAGTVDIPVPRGSEIIKDGTTDGRWHVRTPVGNEVWIEPDPLARWMQAFFLFLAQKLPALEVTTQALPHTYLQRYRHKNINGEPITIVTWRRRQEGDYQEGTGRTLHFRHIRRGHWRKSRRKIDGEWKIYPIYIHPTVVGSPDLPFRPHTVVNKVSR